MALVDRVIIFAGSSIDDYGWLKSCITVDDFIICADSGLHHAHHIGVTPDVIIGDFDSVDKNLLQSYISKSKIIHDSDQNSTDLMKALDIAPACNRIDIYGAIGQRADHDFSNYLILMNMDTPDNITLHSPYDERRIIKSPCAINGNIGDKVGIFPLTNIHGLSFDGLKYPANALPQSHTFGWNGACNEMTNQTASITFTSGTILITHSKG